VTQVWTRDLEGGYYIRSSSFHIIPRTAAKC